MNLYILRVLVSLTIFMHYSTVWNTPEHIWGLSSDIDSKVDILLENNLPSCGTVMVTGPGAISITSAGHYCLGSNTSGITINASNVALDLSGHTVGTSGIVITGDSTAAINNIVIQNGFIVGSGSIGNGISVTRTIFGLVNIQFSNLSISSFAIGIQAACSELALSNVIVYSCVTGINMNTCSSSTSNDCQVYSNSGVGFQVQNSENITINNCIASTNSTGYLITGATEAHGSIIISNCIAQNNSSVGFQTGVGATSVSCQNGVVIQNSLALANGNGFSDATSATGARQYFSNIAAISITNNYTGAGAANFNISGSAPLAPTSGSLSNGYQNITITNPGGCTVV